MKRLTRLCRDTEGGKYSHYTVANCIGIYQDSILGEVVERLAYYENLDENCEELFFPTEEEEEAEILKYLCSKCWAKQPCEATECYNYKRLQELEQLKQYF